MMLIASNGRIVDANASACQLFHYPQQELNGLSVECLVPEDVRSHHSQLREAYYRVPGKRKIGEGRELLGLTKQGKKLTLELIIEQLLLGKDRITLLTAFDVSQRKEAEQNIHLAIDAAASAMIMCDNRRIIRLVNFAAEELFGYSRGELVGQAIDMLIPNEIRHVHSVYVRGFINQQQSRAMGPGSELHAVHKDGSYIPVEIGLKLIDSPVGEMIMTTIIDLSERRAATLALTNKAQELSALNTELSRFAYSTSHELKAPLVTIKGLIEASLEDLNAKEFSSIEDQLQKAQNVCQRGLDTIETVLSISNSHNKHVLLQETDVQLLIENTWQSVPNSTQSGIELICKTDLAPRVNTDVESLRLTLDVLFSNAIRYKDAQKSKPVIKVDVRTTRKRLQFVFKDNGTGIAKEHQQKVFDLFERVDEHSSRGLGLSLARKHIERSGGKISLSSIPGKHTTFKFDLPYGDVTPEQEDKVA